MVRIGTLPGMEIAQLIQSVREYAAAAGVKPETIARNATGNPRSLERLLRRHERLCADAERIANFMAENPLPVGSTASCLPPNREHSVSGNQEATGQEIQTGAAS